MEHLKLHMYFLPEPKTGNLDCLGSFSFSNVEQKTTIRCTFPVKNIGVNDSELNWTISSYPNLVDIMYHIGRSGMMVLILPF